MKCQMKRCVIELVRKFGRPIELRKGSGVMDDKDLINFAKEARLKLGMLEAPDINTISDAIQFLKVAGEHNTGFEAPFIYEQFVKRGLSPLF